MIVYWLIFYYLLFLLILFASQVDKLKRDKKKILRKLDETNTNYKQPEFV